MSAAAGSPSLRFCIAERLGVIAGDGARPLGRRLGVAGTTISRWGSDPYAWGFHAVDVALRDSELRDALLDYLLGTKRHRGEGVRVQGDLLETLAVCGELVREISRDLRDGRITAQERRGLRKLAKSLVKILTERVIPDLEALDV